MRKLLLLLLTLLAANGRAQPSTPPPGLPPMISRELFFGNPERIRARLSPDGTRLAWLAPDKNNVLQVWVKTVGKEDGKIVTADRKRGINQYSWAKDDRTLLYLQDDDGDENFHLYGVDLNAGLVRDFTPIQGVAASIVDMNKEFPHEVLVQMNARDRTVFDVYRLNLDTGSLVLNTQNPGDVQAWIVDTKFQVRGASVATPDGGTEMRVRATPDAPWKSFLTVGPDEILEPVGFNGDGTALYLRSSLGRDTTALVSRPLDGGPENVIAASDVVDAGSVVMQPDTHRLEAVQFAPGRAEWRVLDPEVQADFDGIAKLQDGDSEIVNRTAADDVWLVAIDADKAPTRYYRWDRRQKTGEFLFATRPQLEGRTLAATQPVVIPARDGLKIYSYLTLPAGAEAKNLPMVLLPHGGPWSRDTWGFDGLAQWLANRGYAVLQPNFRGSTGYGKKFLFAGNKEWGLTMHDDLIDCVNWAVAQGVADPKRVGILGGSYGGYCALAAVTYTPEVFACSVDLFGPSNLRTLIATIPPYWKTFRRTFDVRMGNVDDPAEAALITHASPLTYADRIVRPLLIGQGGNDARVKPAESEQIVAAIEKRGGSVAYVLYPDEGHGFVRPENNLDFFARAEAFLAAHLGGRMEPFMGERVAGSSAVVRVIGQPLAPVK